MIFADRCAVGAYMSMFGTNVWPRQTNPILLLGSITSAVGITVLAFATYSENQPVIFGMMALVGTGVGLRLNTASIHALAYFPDLTAQITCLVAFAVPFGGTVVLTIMSTVFNNKTNVAGGDPTENAKQGVKWAFVAVMPFMWLCVVICAFLGNVWIEKEGGHEVTTGMWMISLITRRPVTREKRQRGNLTAGQSGAPAPRAIAFEGDIETGKGASLHQPEAAYLEEGRDGSGRAW
jgi:hypothetical protein